MFLSCWLYFEMRLLFWPRVLLTPDSRSSFAAGVDNAAQMSDVLFAWLLNCFTTVLCFVVTAPDRDFACSVWRTGYLSLCKLRVGFCSSIWFFTKKSFNNCEKLLSKICCAISFFLVIHGVTSAIREENKCLLWIHHTMALCECVFTAVTYVTLLESLGLKSFSITTSKGFTELRSVAGDLSDSGSNEDVNRREHESMDMSDMEDNEPETTAVEKPNDLADHRLRTRNHYSQRTGNDCGGVLLILKRQAEVHPRTTSS